jgi:hypothetical protein
MHDGAKGSEYRLGYGVKHHFQQYFIYIVQVSFIGGGNRSTQDTTTNLPQVTDKLDHIMLHQAGFEFTLVVIGTDCIGSCKSNYHTIMTMMAPRTIVEI